MWHKAPCLSRDYNEKREVTPLNRGGQSCCCRLRSCWCRHRHDGSPDYAPGPSREMGRAPPPPSSSCLDSPRWEKDSPSDPSPPWPPRGRSPSRLDLSLSPSLSLSLCFLLCFASLFSGRRPFLKYSEIHISNRAKNLTQFFSWCKLPCGAGAPLPYEVPNRLTRCPPCHIPGGRRAPALWCPWDSSSIYSCTKKSHIFHKNLRKIFSCLDFVWYGFLWNSKTSKKQELALGTRSVC
jgi:hypothetical protein